MIIDQQQERLCTLTIYSQEQYDEFEGKPKNSYNKVTQLFIAHCDIPFLKFNLTTFQNIKILSLDNNKLQSIQHLSNFCFYALQRLLLYNNCIFSLKPLCRILMNSQIVELSLSFNPLHEPLSTLSVCELSSLKQLRLYHIGKGYNINEMAKLNSFFVAELGVNQVIGQQMLNMRLQSQLFRASR